MPLPEPEPDGSKRRILLRLQEQQSPKVPEKPLIHPAEPLRDGERLLPEIAVDQNLTDRVPARFVAHLKLDPRVRLRLEDRHAGADVGRLLHKQREVVSQRDRLDPDLDPALDVSIGQQPPNRGARTPDPDPAAPNLRSPGAFEHQALQSRNLHRALRVKKSRDRLALLVGDLHLNLDTPGRVEVAEHQLHGPAAPLHVVGEVERVRAA